MMGDALTLHGELQAVANRGEADPVSQLCGAADRPAIGRYDDITFLDSALFRRRSGADLRDHGAFRERRRIRSGDGGGQILDRDTDPAALHVAILHDLLHDPSRHVDRHSEANPDIPASGRKHGRVDAEELAAHIDQGSAGIPRIDGRIGLDEILVALLAETGAAEGADNARCHSLSKAEGIADGDHEVTDFEAVAVAYGDGLEVLHALQAQYGNVRAGITPDELGSETPAILGCDLDGGGLHNHVVGREYVALLCVDDDARSDRLALALELRRQIEELAERRVAVVRVVLLAPALAGDVDDAGRDLAHQRCQRRHFSIADVRHMRQGSPRGDQATDDRQHQREATGHAGHDDGHTHGSSDGTRGAGTVLFLQDWPLVDTAGPLVQTSAVIVKKSLPEHSSSVRLRDGGFLLPALRVWEADQSRAPCRCGQRHAIRGPLRIVQWSSADIFAQTPISGLLAAPRVRQEAARSLGNTAGVLRAPQ